MLAMTADGWDRVAELARHRRIELRLTQLQVAIASHTSESTIRAIESARRDTYQPSTLHGISEALRWTPDSIERILGGGEPVLLAEADEAGLEQRVETLEETVARFKSEFAEIKAALAAERMPATTDRAEEIASLRELQDKAIAPNVKRHIARLIEMLQEPETPSTGAVGA